MKDELATFPSIDDYSKLPPAALLTVIRQYQEQLAKTHQELVSSRQELIDQAQQIQDLGDEIQRLEELLRLRRVQRFAASSEQSRHNQGDLFDEVELEATIESLRQQLPESAIPPESPSESPKSPKTPSSRTQSRNRGFSDKLPRRRIKTRSSVPSVRFIPWGSAVLPLPC